MCIYTTHKHTQKSPRFRIIIPLKNSVDPIRDIEVINVELVLSDLEIVMSRINKIGKKLV